MARKSKQIIDDTPQGAPEWMVTFSDCMTLLLTFFVLLLSFATFDDGDFEKLTNAMGPGMKTVKMAAGTPKEGMEDINQVAPIQQISKGSRVKSDAEKSRGNMQRERRLTQFKHQKVFAISSDKMFIARGSIISKSGVELLETMAHFLREMPSRIVISECKSSQSQDVDELGIVRCLVIMNKLISFGVSKDSFSISGSTMLSKSYQDDTRKLVLTLLERDIYE